MTLSDIVALLIGFGWGSVAETAFYKVTHRSTGRSRKKFIEDDIKTWRKGSSIGLASAFAAGVGMYIGSRDVLLSLSIPAGYVIGQLAARSAIGYARRFVPESA